MVDPDVDKIEIGEKLVKEQNELLYFKLNKPR
jgi:hypothetical protein